MAKRKPKRPVTLAGPGYEGKRELVAEIVESPYGAGLPDGHAMRREKVVRNARHDPIEQLYNQRDRKGRRLIGEGERAAGARVRQLVEALGLDAVRSVVLDGTGGGGQRLEIADHRIDAGRRMAQLRAHLGADMTALLVRVAGYGETITVCAADFDEDPEGASNGACSKTARDRTGFMLRLALERAADFFGYGAAQGPQRKGILAWLGEGARPAVQESYAAAGKRVERSAHGEVG